VLDLGEQYVSDFLADGEQGVKVPLIVAKCALCELVQLDHSVDPDTLYRQFWYQSGISSSMRTALADIVSAAQATVTPRPDDVVLDIGCNDGTLFTFYPSYVKKVGFEPADHLAHGRGSFRSFSPAS
jgi:hypothetical protein